MKIDEVKEFISNPRNRALVKLGFFLLFFIFVAVMCRVYSSPSRTIVKEETKTPLVKFSEMRNYEFDILYKENSTTTNIHGKTFRTDSYLTIEDVNYYVNNNAYEIQDDKFILTSLDDKYLIKTNQIEQYVNSGTLISKSEDYKNNILITKYSIPVINLENQSIKELYITLYEKEKTIYKVDLEYIDNMDSSSLLSITYYNIGGVSNFTTIFDSEKVR